MFKKWQNLFFCSFSENDDEEVQEGSDVEKIEARIELDEKPVLQPHHDNEWSLVCSSVKEWSDLIEKYSNAKDKNEKTLLKGLKELNEIMPDIFVEKVKIEFQHIATQIPM